MAKRRVRTHVYQRSDIEDVRGRADCAVCYLPETNDIHKVPPQAVEVTEFESRLLGEHDNEENENQ